MSHPTSIRFVPIRETVTAALVAASALAEVKSWVQDREAFGRLPVSGLPALGVFFADNLGRERARWVSNQRDYSYTLEVHAAVRSLESAQACEDLLLGYVEAIEDTLRETPTLGGLVRMMSVSLARRKNRKVETYWHSQAVLRVVCESKV